MTQNQTTSLVQQTPPQAGAIAKWNATPEQVQLLKNTIAKGTTDDEFALFMTVAKHMDLNPFLRQIHAVRRWDPDQERMVMQIQTGIDGYRLMAERSGVYGGQEGPLWCGDDGQWVDVWLAKTAPAAAKVIVHRTDKPRPFIAIALWAEYAQTKKDGTLTAIWRKRGPGQLAKCAEALAFRRAFPIEIGGGAHVDVEIDQDFIEAEAVEAPKFTAPPAPLGPPPGVPQAPTTNQAAEAPRRGPGRNAHPTTPPGASGSAETSKLSPTNTAPSGSPANSPSTSSGAVTAADPFQGAREALEQRDRWGQPVGDPTSAGGPSGADGTPASAQPSETSSVGGPTDGAPADDGFGGEDPEDSQPAPTGDPGVQLIQDLKTFLAGCKTQTEMQQGRSQIANRAVALFNAGDERFRAQPKDGKPVGELSKLLGKLWAERKAQLPV